MGPGAQLVRRDSSAYREFARLYHLAQTLRPTGVDRWNGELWATEGDRWGGFNPGTGRIALSGEHVLRHLVSSGPASRPEERAQALATVLHEATHAGMPTDAPNEANAVRSEHSLGVMEGFAEVRALEDFEAFTHVTGHTGLTVPEPQYPAAHAAVQGLLEQASGPRTTLNDLIAEGTRGPGVMHFDQLADGVLRNRLHDVVPDRPEHRLAVRAALIEPMMHRGWVMLKDVNSAETGREVARNIRSGLDARVDEIQRHYKATPDRVFPAEGMNAGVVRVAEGNRLAGLPPPVASDRVERAAPGGEPTPMTSARTSVGADERDPERMVKPELLDAAGRPSGQQSGSGSMQASATDGVPRDSGTDGGVQVRGTDGELDGQGTDRGPEGRGEAGGSAGRESADGVAMRFLDGQAPAAGAVGWRPRLGQGERRAGQGGAAGSREVDGPGR